MQAKAQHTGSRILIMFSNDRTMPEESVLKCVRNAEKDLTV